MNQGTANQQALVTTYSYDELGNRLTQTDANQHTTRFEYDSMGRRTRRILPLGQAEDYTYDDAGNLKTRTDFNRHTTTYNYDDNNRLISKIADAYFSTGACANLVCGATDVDYSYNDLGQRLSMTDASGATTYSYDNRGRLLTRATPFGTLTYTYDAANLRSVQSSNINGISDSYTYDDLNRLSAVTDFSGNTTYTYDPVGNLQSFTYANGVLHGYVYDTLNRLTNMTVSCGMAVPGCSPAGASNSASYTYTLGPSGNRLSVQEISGRTVQYGYDDLYRLTFETISGAAAQNGAIAYQYDPVGNRLSLSSTVSAIPSGMLNYDANDRLTTDVYDDSGNTVSSGGIANVYDFENHPVQHGNVTLVYDGDGNRVSETAGGVTTKYLVDTNSLTGYAQVADDLQNGTVSRSYSYGLSRISESQIVNGNWSTSFYGYDGHGSVRQLTNASGTVTDTYDYDAFGNLIASYGTTPNNFLFAGEQFDPALGVYYNRARYYDSDRGRFTTVDPQEPTSTTPASLHRYLYVNSNPIDYVDPTGFYTQAFGYAVEREIYREYVNDFGVDNRVSFGKWTKLGAKARSGLYALKPDILDMRSFRGDESAGRIWMEIKPLSISGIVRAQAAWILYSSALGTSGITPDMKWLGEGRIVKVERTPTLVFNEGGILFYTTSKDEYKKFQEALESIRDLTGAASIGATAGTAVNLLSRFLPEVATNPGAVAEVIDISTRARLATTASQIQLETDLAAGELEAVSF